MILFQATVLALATMSHSPTLVSGHGYLKTPRSRNWYAHDIIIDNKADCPDQIGCPPPEYCQHCLNTNTGVCGKSPTRDYETSNWIDKTGSPMPWISQVGGNAQDATAPYVEGGRITIDSYLDTHHNGHMEIRACVVDDMDPSKCTTFEEFEGNELHFVEDRSDYPYGMPADPDWPERGMYSGGQGGTIKNFSFEYKLPDGISGEKILLQWKYITANSCSPPGYAKYFGDHPNLPSTFWTEGVSDCTPPYPNDGSRSSTDPEQFFNCAEISILPGSPPEPTLSPQPTDSPTTLEPTTSQSPSNPPVTKSPHTPGPPPPPPCFEEWDDCTNIWTNCCEGYKCVQVDQWGYGKCLVDTCDGPGPTGPTPTKNPTRNPNPNATPNPTKSATPYPTNPTPTNPTDPNPGGCCTINLKTCNHPEGSFCDDALHCENECGKIWLPNGPLEDCTALWEGPCSSDSDCCQWGQCVDGACESGDPWRRVTTGMPVPTTLGPTPATTPNPTNSPTLPVPTSSPTRPIPPSPTSKPTTAAPITQSPTSKPTTAAPITESPTSKPTTAAPHGGAFPNDYSTKVRVNQVGYLRFATKIGVIVDDSTSPHDFQIQDTAGSVLLAGATAVYGADGASGDHVHQADFSSLTSLGSYKLVVDGIGCSLQFGIAPSLYPNLPHEAMNYFYFHRMGTEIEGKHLIDNRYARAALHPQDTAVPPYSGWCATCDDFDLKGSWADAGDFGIYTVNHAISAWTLLNLNELFPEAFVDGELDLPESGNGLPDVLDEVDYGSRFVRGMLPSDGGLASHKAHNHAWSAFTITVDGENAAAGSRSAMGSSSPATYAVARVNAQLARMYWKKGGNAAYTATLWNAAKDAWERAQAYHTANGKHKIYDANEASPGPAAGGGDYPDSEANDDQYAAACEMYLTAYALADGNVGTYKSAMRDSSFFTKMSQWDWASVTGAGTLSLYAVDNDLNESDKMWIEANIVDFADKVNMAFDSEGFPSNLNFPSEFGKYPWGSNSFIMNRMIALAYAYEITGDLNYQKYILRSMDYLMGTNAMDISYITGYGERAETDTHDRWAWTIGTDNFWPKGWLSGGPNNELINDYETPGGVAAAKSYAGPGTAPHAWGSKENTVNWNAPLAWAAWYIENKVVPNLGGCGGNCAPVAESWSGKLLMNSPVSLVLSANDYDGTVASWQIVDSPAFGSLSGTAPNIIYTPNQGAVGRDTFTFKVIDDSNLESNIASVSLLVRDCDLIDIFQVPSSYPPFNGSYNYVHISEDGPSLDNMKAPAHNAQWDGSSLNQFSLELEVSPYYLDVKSTCMANPASLSGSQASFTLNGCGINGLDGDYWVTNLNNNEIWVEKNNGWAIVFTNDANYTPEFCRSSGPTGPTRNSTASPSKSPSKSPTSSPSRKRPTDQPSEKPVTDSPTSQPTQKIVTNSPTVQPTNNPTSAPSKRGSTTPHPTTSPTRSPTNSPTTNQPTIRPTHNPTTSRPTHNPTPPPTPKITPAPTSKPTSGGTKCCADRHLGYECKNGAYCNKNSSNCGNCNGKWMSTPIVRTGCCTWNNQNCRNWDPMNNAGCQFLQSDCEGSCSGKWMLL